MRQTNTILVLPTQAPNTNLVLAEAAEAGYHFGMTALRLYRKQSGLSQAELADRIGTSQPQIKRLEAGDRKMTKEWAVRLAPHLNVSAERLLFEPATASEPPASSSDGFHVAPEVHELLNHLFDLTGMRQADLARKIKVSQSTVSKWLSQRQYPNKAQWDALVTWVRNDPRTRHLIEPPPQNIVPLEGYVGAGAEITPETEQIPEGGLFPIEVQWALKEPMVAFEIVGHSMLPRYDPGYVVICYKEGRLATRMVGQEVVTRLRDGRRFLKRLRHGTKPRKFNLESVNAPLIENVEPAWVGEIHVIVPPSQFRKLT